MPASPAWLLARQIGQETRLRCLRLGEFGVGAVPSAAMRFSAGVARWFIAASAPLHQRNADNGHQQCGGDGPDASPDAGSEADALLGGAIERDAPLHVSGHFG